MRTRLYPFQKEGVLQIEAFDGRCLLADDMGLGKTIQTLTFLRRNPESLPAAVVCPAALKWNWEREAKVHIGMPAEVLEGTKPPKRKRWIARHPLVILNYDILGPWLPYLKSLGLRTVVVEEAHYCKSRSAQRSKNTKELCRGVPYILALSGTPLVNRPAELWNILNILQPSLFPSFMKYAFEFCAPKMTPFGWDFRGASNLDKLNRILRRECMVRRRKEDVLADLPEKQRNVIPLALSRAKEYKDAEIDFIQWLRKNKGEAKARRAKRAERMVRMGYLKRLAAELKLPAVKEWTDLFLEDSEEKLVLFAIHKTIIKDLREHYHRQCVVIDGSVTGRERQRAVDQFIKTKKTRILIGNIQAAGVGWSAKGVSNVAFAEIEWTPGATLQAEDRAHGLYRGKEGEHTSIHYLVARKTVEERLLRILQEKQNILSLTLDGQGNGHDLDVYSLLEKELLKDKPRLALGA